MKNFKARFFLYLFLFACFNMFLYVWMVGFHPLIPFSKTNYAYNAHHYLKDPRIENPSSFSFLRALGEFDGQWYLRIADKGYPFHPAKVQDVNNHQIMDGLTYAFFPLYPLSVTLVNFLFHQVELSAFIMSNVFLLLDFVALFLLTKSISSEQTALKTVCLFFLYPLSIFYHTYFTEGLYLLLLLGFAYFLLKKNITLATLCLAFLNVTKATGWLLDIYLLWLFWKAYKEKSYSLVQLIGLFFILILPSVLWILFCWYQTGNPVYFVSIRSNWSHVGYFAIFHNLSLFLKFDLLPFHYFHSSKLDILSIFTTGVLLFLSVKKIPSQLWWISFCLFLSPLLVTDTMSYSRYQIVSFPLFFYLAQVLPKKYVLLLSSFFFVLLGLTALLLVNWYWLG
jgi:hypothetical protein